MDGGEEIDWLRSMPQEEARLGCQAGKQRCDIFHSSCSRCFYVLLDLVSCAVLQQAKLKYFHMLNPHMARFTFWLRFF